MQDHHRLLLLPREPRRIPWLPSVLREGPLQEPLLPASVVQCDESSHGRNQDCFSHGGETAFERFYSDCTDGCQEASNAERSPGFGSRACCGRTALTHSAGNIATAADADCNSTATTTAGNSFNNKLLLLLPQWVLVLRPTWAYLWE